MKLSRRRLEAMDKRQAAIHESGHLTIGCSESCWCRAWIFPDSPDDPYVTKTWLGRYEQPPPMSSTTAVAGVVAECWMDDPGTEAWQIVEMIEDEGVLPSPTDISGFPIAAEMTRTVDQALALLKQHRAFFEWAVRKLIREKYISEYAAAKRFYMLDPGRKEEFRRMEEEAWEHVRRAQSRCR